MLSYKVILLCISLLLLLPAWHVASFDRYRWWYSFGLQFLLPKLPTRAPAPLVRRCASNETFRVRGMPCGKSCGTYGQGCPIREINRCQCLVGYARNRSGVCVHHMDCPLNLDDAEFLSFLK